MSGFSEIMNTWWMWLIPAAFIVVLIYVFSPRRKKQFDDNAKICIRRQVAAIPCGMPTQ